MQKAILQVQSELEEMEVGEHDRQQVPCTPSVITVDCQKVRPASVSLLTVFLLGRSFSEEVLVEKLGRYGFGEMYRRELIKDAKQFFLSKLRESEPLIRQIVSFCRNGIGSASTASVAYHQINGLAEEMRSWLNDRKRNPRHISVLEPFAVAYGWTFWSGELKAPSTINDDYQCPTAESLNKSLEAFHRSQTSLEAINLGPEPM